MSGAAQLQGCALLLTEDLQDGGVYGGVTVRSPFTLELGEASAMYTVTPASRGRARPTEALEALSHLVAAAPLL